MTTLTDKFTTLEGQLTTEQIALLAALEPLADVNTNIVAITSAIEAMSSALTTSLTDLFDLLDTVNNNAAGNAQAILAAIAFYSCCDIGTAPEVPPIPGTGGSASSGADKCKRIQYFLDVYKVTWGTAMVGYVGLAGSISPSVVAGIMADGLTDLSITDGNLSVGVPGSTRIAVANAINALVAEMGVSTGLSALSTALSDATLRSNTQTDLLLAASSSAGLTAWLAEIAATSHSSLVKGVLSAMAYSAFTNDIFSAVPDVDDSGYSGTACTFDLIDITTCTQFVATSVVISGSTFYGIFLTPVYSGYAYAIAGDFIGWTFHLISNAGGTNPNLYYYNLSGGQVFVNDVTTSSTRIITAHTSAVMIITPANVGAAFTVEICPP